jgi:DNA-binding protein Fis
MFILEIIKGFTKVTISLQANAVNMMGFNENVLEKKMKKQLKENLAMLKNILEAG